VKRKVIVPYTEIHPLVKEVLDKEGVEYVRMIDKESYWRLLCDLWALGEDVVIVEHDIIPWPGAIDELLKCPAGWCTYTYEMKEGFGVHHAFGCAKLGATLMSELPDVWKNVGTTYWRTLDSQLCDYAQRHAIIPHPHRPPVTHLRGMNIYKGLYEENEVKDGEQRSQAIEDALRERKNNMVKRAPGVSICSVAGNAMRLNVSGDRTPQDAPGETSCESRVFYDTVPESPPVGGR
jgi:hypothetical protein